MPCFSLLDCHKVLFMRGILPLQGAFRQVILTQRYSEKRIPNLWVGMWALPLDMHEAMRDKYLKGVFGTCPRVLCDSTGLRWILDGEQCAVAVYPSSQLMSRCNAKRSHIAFSSFCWTVAQFLWYFLDFLWWNCRTATASHSRTSFPFTSFGQNITWCLRG